MNTSIGRRIKAEILIASGMCMNDADQYEVLLGCGECLAADRYECVVAPAIQIGSTVPPWRYRGIKERMLNDARRRL